MREIQMIRIEMCKQYIVHNALWVFGNYCRKSAAPIPHSKIRKKTIRPLPLRINADVKW